MQIRNISISLTLSILTVLVVSLAPVMAVCECLYETRLASWQLAEETGGTPAETLMRPGVPMIVDHITICRNGAAVFLRGRDESGCFAVQFIRANQDAFQDVLRSRFVIEKRISFGSVPEQPSLTLDGDGRVMLKWKHRSTEIVGERSLYVPPDESAPVSFEDWPSETIMLPPGFALELPTGKEMLLFSPGWRNASAVGFWSYAFVMWIDESVPDAERIEELLEFYYDGLMSAFGVDEGLDMENGPAQVEVVRTGLNNYEAKMRLIDGFTTFKPLDLRVVIKTAAENKNRAVLSIKVSPQPRDHVIWRSLEAAIASIQLRND